MLKVEGSKKWLRTTPESLWWRGNGLGASCLVFPLLYNVRGTVLDFSPFLGTWSIIRKFSLTWHLPASGWAVRNGSLTETVRSGTCSWMHKLYVVIAVPFSLTSAFRWGELPRVMALLKSLQNGNQPCQQRDALLWSLLVFLTCLPWGLYWVQPMWCAAHGLGARTLNDLPAVSTCSCRRY